VDRLLIRLTLIEFPVHRLFATGPLPDAADFPAWGDGRWMYLPDGDPGAALAGDLRNQAKALAEAIPAMSLAAGRNRVPEFGNTTGNTDMQGLRTNVSVLFPHLSIDWPCRYDRRDVELNQPIPPQASLS